jgi:hypothetical protein
MLIVSKQRCYTARTKGRAWVTWNFAVLLLLLQFFHAALACCRSSRARLILVEFKQIHPAFHGK